MKTDTRAPSRTGAIGSGSSVQPTITPSRAHPERAPSIARRSLGGTPSAPTRTTRFDRAGRAERPPQAAPRRAAAGGDRVSLFTLEHVSFRALEDVSAEGLLDGATCIWGRSGAGKSTMLRLLNRLAITSAAASSSTARTSASCSRRACAAAPSSSSSCPRRSPERSARTSRTARGCSTSRSRSRRCSSTSRCPPTIAAETSRTSRSASSSG